MRRAREWSNSFYRIMWSRGSFRLRLAWAALRRLADRAAGIEERCEACRRVLTRNGTQRAEYFMDCEGAQLCAPCWDALFFTAPRVLPRAWVHRAGR